MAADETGQPEEKIFPLLDRPSPILDRFRDNGDRESSRSEYERLGTQVAGVSKENDIEVKERVINKAASDMVKGAADEMGVGTDEINEDVILGPMSELFLLDDEELLDQDEDPDVEFEVEEDAEEE